MIVSLPFLFELLDADDFQHKPDLLDMLLKVTSDCLDYKDMWREYLDSILNNMNVVKHLRFSQDIATRLYALEMWKQFVTQDEFNHFVWELAKNEKHIESQVYTLYKLAGELLHQEDTYPQVYENTKMILLRRFAEVVEPTQSLLLAYAIVQMMGENSPSQAVYRLADFLINRDIYHIDERIRSEHFDHYNGIISLILKCGKDVAYSIIFYMLKHVQCPIKSMIHYVNWYNIELYMIVLDLLFDKEHHIHLRWDHRHNKFEVGGSTHPVHENDVSHINLNDKQLEFLTWLINNDLFWSREHNLLVWYGLPTTREKLRKFVEKKSGTL